MNGRLPPIQRQGVRVKSVAFMTPRMAAVGGARITHDKLAPRTMWQCFFELNFGIGFSTGADSRQELAVIDEATNRSTSDER